VAETRATSIYLIRHPEPQGGAGVCYGALDLPLSEKGIRQAQALAESLREKGFAAVYTSPLQRCRRAAELLAARCEIVDDLRELDHGAWEGRTYDEIAASDPGRYREWMERPCEVRFPDGESLADLRERVLAAAAGIRSRHDGQAIAIVTHIGPIRVLLAEALGMPLENMFRMVQSYAGINLIRYSGGTMVLEFMNREAYFPGR